MIILPVLPGIICAPMKKGTAAAAVGSIPNMLPSPLITLAWQTTHPVPLSPSMGRRGIGLPPPSPAAASFPGIPEAGGPLVGE